MTAATGKTLLVIGVGNRYRRDDGVGPLVAERIAAATRGVGSQPVSSSNCGAGLQPVPAVSVAVRCCSGEGAELMAAWEHADAVWLVDAIRCNGVAGRVVRIDARLDTVPADFFRYSTHAFSVAEAVELARVLGTLPERLVIFGVEGADFGSGEGLSPRVARAAAEVAARVLDEIDAVAGLKAAMETEARRA